MKKRIFAIIIAVVLSLSVVTTVSAQGVHIIDNCNLITSKSVSDAEAKAQQIENDYGYYMMFCTTSSIDTETNYDYAQAVYEKNTSSDKGLILLHNITDSVYVVYATPEAEKLFTDTVVNELGDVYNNTETYADGVMAYLNFAETVVASAPDTEETNNNAQETTKFTPVERTYPLVVDNADLLTDDEESKLTSKLETITEEYKSEVAILTVTDLEGKSAQAYADDFFDYNGYGYGEEKDGVLVLFKPGAEGDRKLHITTHGTAIEAFSDSTINDILNAMKDYLIAEDYYTAFDLYADKCEEALQPPSVPLIWIPICLAIGFVLSLIISKIVASSLRPVRKQQNASNYVRKGSMVVTNGQDVFMYRNVSKTEISRNDDNDSSTHTSSSGETHGGGGISF